MRGQQQANPEPVSQPIEEADDEPRIMSENEIESDEMQEEPSDEEYGQEIMANEEELLRYQEEILRQNRMAQQNLERKKNK